MKLNFSVLILTYNEEINIAQCLYSLKECDDIVVIDSNSTDRTVDIAKDYPNVRIVFRSFDNFAHQRNFALDNISFSNKWILHLDADEVVDFSFIEECNFLANKDEKSAYLVPSKLILNNKWVKFSSGYPTYQMRFMKIGEIRFVQVGHGQRESESIRGIGYMKSPYIHYNFSKGFTDWFEKHNRYSSMEAIAVINEMKTKYGFKDVFSMDPTTRRCAQKAITFRLPFRPLIVFFAFYILRRGFLDGKSGYTFCRLRKTYEWMIDLKIKEIKGQQ